MKWWILYFGFLLFLVIGCVGFVHLVTWRTLKKEQKKQKSGNSPTSNMRQPFVMMLEQAEKKNFRMHVRGTVAGALPASGDVLYLVAGGKVVPVQVRKARPLGRRTEALGTGTAEFDIMELELFGSPVPALSRAGEDTDGKPARITNVRLQETDGERILDSLEELRTVLTKDPALNGTDENNAAPGENASVDAAPCDTAPNGMMPNGTVLNDMTLSGRLKNITYPLIVRKPMRDRMSAVPVMAIGFGWAAVALGCLLGSAWELTVSCVMIALGMLTGICGVIMFLSMLRFELRFDSADRVRITGLFRSRECETAELSCRISMLSDGKERWNMEITDGNKKTLALLDDSCRGFHEAALLFRAAEKGKERKDSNGTSDQKS